VDESKYKRPGRMAVLDHLYHTESSVKEVEEYEVPDGTQGSATETGHVLGISSFAKILCPGMRLGWIEAAPSLISMLSNHPYVLSGGGVAPLQAQVGHELLKSGRQAGHLSMLQREYYLRSKTLYEAVLKFPHLMIPAGGAENSQVCGGYFMWVKVVPTSVDTVSLQKIAREKFKVDFLPGERCHPEADKKKEYRGHLRLCFAYMEISELAEGVERLAAAIAHATA